MSKAVILAGGRNEKLRPVTYETPLALIPFYGRPLMDQIIDICFKHKIYEIWLSLSLNNQKVQDEYKSALPTWTDRLSNGQATFLGSGGWLNKLSNSPDYARFGDHFFVFNIHNLLDINLNNMKEQHIKDNNLVTIACTKVKDVRQYGSVHINKDQVQSFEEKKKSRIKKSGWVNGGYYVFSPELFDYIKKMGWDVDKPFSLEKDLFPRLAKEGRLGAYKTTGSWFAFDSFESWTDALKNWKEVIDGQ